MVDTGSSSSLLDALKLVTDVVCVLKSKKPLLLKLKHSSKKKCLDEHAFYGDAFILVSLFLLTDESTDPKGLPP